MLSGEGGEPCSFLNLAEIAGFELDAELVFLSACETARGESVRSEASGMRRVHSCSRVPEPSSRRSGPSETRRPPCSRRRFYEGLFAGATAADALRRAKLALIDGGPAAAETVTRGIGATRSESVRGQTAPVHPAFWAPYVLWGHAR